MLKKHFLWFGILLSICLLTIAIRSYPGGSQQDGHSIGFDWKQNYLSNLFSERAMNGAENASRSWAVVGWTLLCVTIALFYIDFSRKIPSKHGAMMIRYAGVVAMGFAIFIVTSYHDTMLTISGALVLLSLFYITVFVFKSRLTYLKILAGICILLFYFTNYLYYTRSRLNLLPVMQKITLLAGLIWLLYLHYFTKCEDFERPSPASAQSGPGR